jgi:hypothetical protein
LEPSKPAAGLNGIPAGFSLPKDLLQPPTIKTPSFNFSALGALQKPKATTNMMNFELISLGQNNQIATQSDDITGLYRNISIYILK